ncbi:GntR family transcriptional regulator [Embleya hyalina]|uniref:GntR family transcriptional regulator n=1 Tax=Embleya hyalina TaxID=516124 RepID=A0A401YEV2_9ACTN|nr:GntR family transcriptional regulator [Embleya hyalina]GCD93097.1 GntR family transcriptional regulator [Embleya hyalina]
MGLTEMMDRPDRLTDAVHRTLKAAILEGDPAPGMQLSVPELARRLGVSRGSVREAVLQLVADGLAEERPRRGVVVVRLGPAEMRHIHQVREVLEGQAARLCAEAPGPGLVEALEDALDEQRLAIAADSESGYTGSDGRFHALLRDACGNPMLGALIERLHNQMRLALTRAAEAPEHRSCGHDELHQVLRAVRDRDPDAAETAMRRHIRRTRAALEAYEEEDTDSRGNRDE